MGRTDGTEREAPQRRWWQRAGLWIGAVAGSAAIGIGVTAVAQNAETWFAHVTAHGPAVGVHLTLQPGQDDVSLPPGQSLSAQDEARLSGLRVKDADAWLVQHKHGVVTSDRIVALTLTGDSPDPVRVVGLDVRSRCRAPSRGTLVRQVTGRGAGEDSERMIVFPEESDPGPFSYSAAGKLSAYFPARTIVLRPGEQVEVEVRLSPGRAGIDVGGPGQTRECDVRLALSVLQGDRASTQAIDGTLPVMGVEPLAADAAYSRVVIGTGVCDRIYPVPANWDGNPAAACGAAHVTYGAQ